MCLCLLVLFAIVFVISILGLLMLYIVLKMKQTNDAVATKYNNNTKIHLVKSLPFGQHNSISIYVGIYVVYVQYLYAYYGNKTNRTISIIARV